VKSEIIVAGHGGQGVLELANYLAYYELTKGRHVACTPSYGPETRGGKVKCYIIASDGVIDSPIVETPDYLLAMNAPSMDFVPLLKIAGTLLMNSSLIDLEPNRTDIRTFKVPATEIALGLKELGSRAGVNGTKILANSVFLGGFLSLAREGLNMEAFANVFSHFLQGRKSLYVPLNVEAVRRGYEYVQRSFEELPSALSH
jgi:2-oxoglutarate ferredoxin oxidoreductase subunit gamma